MSRGGAIVGFEQTAADLARAEKAGNARVSTYVRWLDRALGGGVHLGSTTEVAGPPGVGKTQFCLSLAVNLQLPEALGGLGPVHAWYIDTEGAFTKQRLGEIARAACRMAERASEALDYDDVMSRVRQIRVTSLLDLLAFSHSLRKTLSDMEELQRPRLLLIDSIAFHFRHARVSASGMTHLSQTLGHIADHFGIAIVYVNQVSTKLGRADGESYLTLALGEAWTYAATYRVHLSFSADGRRMASVVKSPCRAAAEGPFTITRGGFRGRAEG